MSSPRIARSAALAPLLYWLLVLGGLTAAYRVLEHGEASRGVALWIGAIAGTALGQVSAHWRIPVWMLMLFVPVLMVAFIQLGLALCVTGGFGSEVKDPWVVLEIVTMAFIPAIGCGYASLTERGGLVSFWFPTALWALPILDWSQGRAFDGARSWLLLSVLAGLFVAFLAAREARRVALWQRHGAARLATPVATSVLRSAPTRGLAQATWTAATAGATLLLATWIAPHLWQKETTTLPGTGPEPQQVAGAGGVTCCPPPGEPKQDAHRLREYFPLLHPEADAPVDPAPSCVACTGGVPVGTGTSQASSPGTPDVTPPKPAQQITQGVTGSQAPQVAGNDSTWSPPQAQAAAGVHAGPPGPPAPPPLQPLEILPPTPTPVAHAGHPPAKHPPADASPPHAVATFDVHPLPFLLSVVVAALLVQLAMRPLRRAVTLAHLEAPIFPEPVDQRVSNLWQLVLVGLRDAGWHPAAGEQPLALARRAALPGAETCALVLERTRHGIRIDATDLTSMRAAAGTAYHAARRRIGRVARALSWLRWPLV
jgi:hypothetical protein